MEISDRSLVKRITIKGLIAERAFWEVEIYRSNTLQAYAMRIVTNVIDEEVCDDACEAIATLVASKVLGLKGKVLRMTPCTEAPSRGEMPLSEAFFLVLRKITRSFFL